MVMHCANEMKQTHDPQLGMYINICMSIGGCMNFVEAI